MMLAQFILVSLVVFVDDGAFGVDAQGLDREGRYELRGCSVDIRAIQLGSSGEVTVAFRFYAAVVPREQDAAVREHCKRCFVARKIGYAGRNATVFRRYIDVLA